MDLKIRALTGNMQKTEQFIKIEKRREAAKKYRFNHPERIKKANLIAWKRKYYANIKKSRLENAERNRKWYENPINKKKVKVRFLKWKKEHANYAKEQARKHGQKYRLTHPKKRFESWKRWYYKKLGINMDILSPEKRSLLMSKIKSTSSIELVAKKMAERLAGCSLRHQPNGIFGRPDFANKTKKIVVFVNGCFWHQPCPEKCCKVPKNRHKIWRAKFKRNKNREKEVYAILSSQDWKIIIIWEHEINRDVLKRKPKVPITCILTGVGRKGGAK